VKALGEVVGAPALAEVVVLPRLPTAGGGARQDGVAVDEDLDGAQVAGEVVGLAVGDGELALQDRGVVAGAGGVLSELTAMHYAAATRALLETKLESATAVDLKQGR